MTDPTLAASACACGSGPVFAVRPGVEAAWQGTLDFRTGRDKAVEAAVVDRFWCLECWSMKFGRGAA